jgi:hypothetical protein
MKRKLKLDGFASYTRSGKLLSSEFLLRTEAEGQVGINNVFTSIENTRWVEFYFISEAKAEVWLHCILHLKRMLTLG